MKHTKTSHVGWSNASSIKRDVDRHTLSTITEDTITVRAAPLLVTATVTGTIARMATATTAVTITATATIAATATATIAGTIAATATIAAKATATIAVTITATATIAATATATIELFCSQRHERGCEFLYLPFHFFFSKVEIYTHTRYAHCHVPCPSK